jgi:hypothetical protein
MSFSDAMRSCRKSSRKGKENKRKENGKRGRRSREEADSFGWQGNAATELKSGALWCGHWCGVGLREIESLRQHISACHLIFWCCNQGQHVNEILRNRLKD